MTMTADAEASAGHGVDQQCGVCEGGSYIGWGAFLGEYTLDMGSEIQAWMWKYEAGRMVFLVDTRSNGAATLGEGCFILDTQRRVPYCGACADELKSDQGLPPSATLVVLAS